MQGKKLWLVIAGLVLAFCVMIFIKNSLQKLAEAPPEQTSESAESSQNEEAPAAPANIRAFRAKEVSKEELDQEWNSFVKKHGEHFKAVRLENGRMAMMRGAPNQPSIDGFTLNEKDSVQKRADQIIGDLQGLIGFGDRGEMGKGEVKVVGSQATVRYQQRIGGVPIQPYGTVNVRMGQNGEVLGVYSRYVSEVDVANSPTLSEEAARNAVKTEMASVGNKIDAVTNIIWMDKQETRPTGPVPGRHAYDFEVQGRRVVVDAESGEVLFRSDRRQR